jgi:flagellar hook-length control protein FliK
MLYNIFCQDLPLLSNGAVRRKYPFRHERCTKASVKVNRFFKNKISGTKIMLQTIPISSQANTALSKNPKGIHESELGVGDFPSVFAAASAVRRNTDGFLQGVSKGKNGEKVDSKEECESPKDQDLLVQSDASEAEKSDELLQDNDEEAFTATPLLIEEDPQQAVAPISLTGPLTVEQAVKDIGVSESLKSEIKLFENPKIPFNVNTQNPIVGKENNINVKFPLSQRKQDLKVLNTPLDTEKRVGPNLDNVSAKLSANESEPQPADVKSALKFHGEKDVSGEGFEIRNAKKGIENLNSATAKIPQQAAIADVVKEKATLKPSRNSDAPWTGSSKKSGKFSHGRKISKKIGPSKDPGKTILSSKASTNGKKAIEKNTVAIGGDKFEMKSSSRRSPEGGVTPWENQVALKDKVKMEAVAGKSMGPGDKGSPLKNNVLFSDFHPAKEIISGENKIVEKSDPKSSTLNANETSGRILDARETETQSTKPGSDNREGQGDAEKRNRFRGKEFHGTLEKIEFTKGEDAPFLSKARYGSDNGTNPIMAETEKETQRSPGGKENLGSLVRTTAFLLKNGRQEARMALQPESLGHLKIRILTENQQVTVKVMAETVVAKELLENNLHQLKADFQNQGLEISKFDVSLSQDSDRNGTGQNPSFASNRTKDKSGPKKEENTRQSEKTEKTASNANRARHNDAVDYFA